MASQRNNTCHMQNLNVKDVRYTQKTIRDTFSDGIPLQYTIDMLKSGKIKPEDIKPIRVGKYNGHYRTIDNRRLYCFKQSNITKIKVKYIHDIGNLPDFHDKYTSNNGGISIKIRKEHAETFFYCDVCDINMTFPDKMPHLNGKRHYENALQETFFYCDVCDANMTFPDKMPHLNGRRHHKNLKKQNADNSVKNKKLNCIRDEAIIACGLKSVEKNTMVKPTISAKIPVSNKNAETFFYCDVCHTNIRLPDKMWHLNGKKHQKNRDYQIKCGWKPIAKNTTVTHTKSAKIATSNNKYVVNGKIYKKAAKTNAPIQNKTVRKPPLTVQKSIKNKSENVKDDKLAAVRPSDIKAVGSDANNKGIYDVKVRIEQSKSNNVLEQVIAAKTQQIHNYEAKLRKIEQANIAIDIDADIDVDLDKKKQYKFENKKNICTVMGTLGVGVCALYFLAKKYI